MLGIIGNKSYRSKSLELDFWFWCFCFFIYGDVFVLNLCRGENIVLKREFKGIFVFLIIF